MQPDYVGKPEDLSHVSPVLDRGVKDMPVERASDALLLRMRHQYTHYRDKAVP
jgi:hypothetical protein